MSRPDPASITFESVASPSVPWGVLDGLADRTVFQTRSWSDFLVQTQGAEPLFLRVSDRGQPVGWFTGAITSHRGLRVLGAPLKGWTTPSMGFNADPDGALDRTAALAALAPFAYRELGCWHLEYADRALLEDAAVPAGFRIGHLRGYERDLPVDDDELLASFTRSGRRDVRRSLRNGIEVEEVHHTDPQFAAEYYRQVTAAFARRALTPTFPIERVQALMGHLGPTGNLLLLRARTAGGEPAATGIFPGLRGRTAEFWMGASDPAHQHLLPNEALMWKALLTWRDRGAVRFNFGGGGSYKAKYGGQPHRMPWVRRSRVGALEEARKMAQGLQRRRQRRR